MTRDTSPKFNRHLSDDELDALMLDEGAAEDRLHLAGCVACRARQASFQDVLVAFNHASLASSEARSGQLACVESTKRSGSPMRDSAWAFSLAMFVCMLFWSNLASKPSLGVIHKAASTESGEPVAAAAPVDGAKDIAADNAMLAGIETALSQSDVSPLGDLSRSNRTEGLDVEDSRAN